MANERTSAGTGADEPIDEHQYQHVDGPHEEPVDLGMIEAVPVAGRQDRAIGQRPLRSILEEVRSGTAGVAGDIVSAHRGPKENTRPVPGWIASLAWLLDESVPVGAKRRVGIDGIIGFVPGVGDAAGLVASMVVVLAGIASGVSLPTLTLMLVNVGVDTIVGAVPFLGAVFDLGFKANTRNLRLIEKDHRDRAGAKRSAVKAIVFSMLAIFTGAILLLIALVGGIYLFVRLVSGLF